MPSTGSAPGLWRDREQYLARRDSIWPIVPYRYLRLNMTALNGDGYVELERLAYLVGATAYPTVNMTSNSAPSPLVASTNSVLSAGYEAFYAFSTNGDAEGGGSSRWHSGNPTPPIWIQLDLGSGNAIRPTAIEYTPRFAGGTTNRTPSSFQVLGSNTGAFSGEQETLYSATGVTTGWANLTMRTFTF